MSGEFPESITIPPDRVRKLLLHLDGMWYACAICNASYERALSALHSFEFDQQPEQVPANQVTLAIGDVWSVVDSAYRVRVLTQRMPYSKFLRTECEIFERNTRVVEDLRHYVQHLDETISALPENATPVWGSIAWQSAKYPRVAFTLVAGTPLVGQSHYSLVWDRFENKFVRPLDLAVGNVVLDIDGTVRSVSRLNLALQAWSETFKFEDGRKYEYAPVTVNLLKLTVSECI